MRARRSPSRPPISIRSLGSPPFAPETTRKAVEWAARALGSAEQALAAQPPDAIQVRKAATAAIAHATNTIGVALARSGQLEAARECVERSLATSRESGLLEVACRAYANLGVLYSTIEPKRAIDVSLTGLEIASKIGAASLQSYIYANLAAAYCALTDRCETEGLQAAMAAVALDRDLGQLDHLAVPLVVMAQIHQCRGELQKASDAYSEALALAERIGEPQLILPCYDGLATIHLDRGDRARAEEFMEKARAAVGTHRARSRCAPPAPVPLLTCTIGSSQRPRYLTKQVQAPQAKADGIMTNPVQTPVQAGEPAPDFVVPAVHEERRSPWRTIGERRRCSSASSRGCTARSAAARSRRWRRRRSS